MEIERKVDHVSDQGDLEYRATSVHNSPMDARQGFDRV